MLIPTRILIIIMLSVLLSACGFQLRGQQSLPPQLDSVYIQGEATGLLLRHLKDALRISGATVVSSPDTATAILHIKKQTNERQVLSVGVAARVRQYEAVYQVIYSLSGVDGKTLMKDKTIKLRRDFSYNEELALAKNREEELLLQEMQYQAAQTILRNIRSIK